MSDEPDRLSASDGLSVHSDLFQGGERLVGLGMRCWLAGYETGDIRCWEEGWRIYADRLGTDKAKTVVTELACWVRTLSGHAARRIEFFPFYGPFEQVRFCRDECLGICMIAAGQHGDAAMARRCAGALIGAADSAAVEQAGKAFGVALAGTGIALQAGLLSETDRGNPN